MKLFSTTDAPVTMTQELPTATTRRSLSIGIPKSTDPNELRFPLTPEGAQMLVEQGFTVRMQPDAAASIHYTDAQFTRCGVDLADRDEVLRSDIVICLSPLTPSEVHKMRKGALLLCLHENGRQPRETILALLDRHIISIALDLITDSRGNTPFADILSETDGRAAIALAASLLADPIHGKGILLGGVAGVVPCEVTIIGSGIAARAAARSAAGAGAMVRMFDNDVYRLRDAGRELGSFLICSSLHPRVVSAALRSADVVVLTDNNSHFTVDKDLADEMKRGVIVFDLSHDPGKAFPSMPTIDLASAASFSKLDRGATRVAFINAGSAVPRTCAMALSNTFLTLFNDMVTYDGISNAIRLVPGLQRAALTFLGKAVNTQVARTARVRHVDISIFLTIS